VKRRRANVKLRRVLRLGKPASSIKISPAGKSLQLKQL